MSLPTLSTPVFARLFFPDRTVEELLRAIPEYEDEYHPQTGEIVITGVIPDGCYQHVLNCLHLLAALNQLDVITCTGIGRDILAKTLVFHDVGKIQPLLVVGERVRPADVFEDGRLHAARSAAYVQRYYGACEAVSTLVYYHHHAEDDLPDTFPINLKPAYRLIRLVDGLSAAMTRRGAGVRLDARGCEVIVHEKSGHPGYNGCYVLDLVSGDVFKQGMP